MLAPRAEKTATSHGLSSAPKRKTTRKLGTGKIMLAFPRRFTKKIPMYPQAYETDTAQETNCDEKLPKSIINIGASK